LQQTKRGLRYWRLRGAVCAAVAASAANDDGVAVCGTFGDKDLSAEDVWDAAQVRLFMSLPLYVAEYLTADVHE